MIPSNIGTNQKNIIEEMSCLYEKRRIYSLTNTSSRIQEK